MKVLVVLLISMIGVVIVNDAAVIMEENVTVCAGQKVPFPCWVTAPVSERLQEPVFAILAPDGSTVEEMITVDTESSRFVISAAMESETESDDQTMNTLSSKVYYLIMLPALEDNFKRVTCFQVLSGDVRPTLPPNHLSALIRVIPAETCDQLIDLPDPASTSVAVKTASKVTHQNLDNEFPRTTRNRPTTVTRASTSSSSTVPPQRTRSSDASPLRQTTDPQNSKCNAGTIASPVGVFVFIMFIMARLVLVLFLQPS